MGYLVTADVTGKSIHVDIHPVHKVKSRTYLVRLFFIPIRPDTARTVGLPLSHLAGT